MSRPKFQVSGVARRRLRIGRRWQTTMAAKIIRPIIHGSFAIGWARYVAWLKASVGPVRDALAKVAREMRRCAKKLRREPPFILRLRERDRKRVRLAMDQIRGGRADV